MKNIVLIGIMGCGKTTIGKILSHKMNRKMIDMDDYLVERFNMTIPAMFDISEDYFRDHETLCAKEASTWEDCIISTGGGVVKRQENINYLKKNGIIFYLDRPIESIVNDVDTSGRPLLKDGAEKLYALDQERRSLYLNACDVHILNNKTLDEISDLIINTYNELTKDL